MLRRFILVIACCTLLFGCSKQSPPLSLDVDKDGGFRLNEISVSEAIQRQPQLAYCGSREYLGFSKTEYWDDATIPKKAVKRYPQLRYSQLKGSKTPLYGSLKFKADYFKPDSEMVEYQFALDATGSSGYDGLYFDANRDLDLTNDRPLRSDKTAWPEGLWSRDKKAGRIFEPITVEVDFGPGYGVRPVKVLPLMFPVENGDKYRGVAMVFVCRSFYAGRIKIADKELDAVLYRDSPVSLGNAYLELYLMEPGKTTPFENWPGSKRLCAYHFMDGKYYTISATPLGDKVFVRPYSGELGTFKVEAGGRDTKGASVFGSLESSRAAVAIGELAQGEVPGLRPVAEWKVPVGDYYSNGLLIRLGPLRIHSTLNFGAYKINREWLPNTTIRIRSDRPFVFDFSNKTEVMFVSPSKNAVYKPGDEVEVNSLLVDQIMDMMVHRLDRVKEPHEAVEDNGAQNQMVEDFKSLDPTVTIADSTGKIVAEGTMPFG